MPEYGKAYDEPEGDAGVNVNDELYPEFASEALAPYPGAGSVPRRGA